MATLPNARPTLRFSRESNGVTISETHARGNPRNPSCSHPATHAVRKRDCLCRSLERNWTSSIALRGFLLEGALRSTNSRRTYSSPKGNEEWESIGEETRMFDSPSGLTPRQFLATIALGIGDTSSLDKASRREPFCSEFLFSPGASAHCR